MTDRWRLVGDELYDIGVDPGQSTDVAADHPALVTELKQAYDNWFDDVSATRPENYSPPRIIIDPDHENPLVLTRQDWRRTDRQGWGNRGYWLIRVERPTVVNVRCHLLQSQPAEQVARRDAPAKRDTPGSKIFSTTYSK